MTTFRSFRDSMKNRPEDESETINSSGVMNRLIKREEDIELSNRKVW